jgi:hypothetical protein
MLKYNINFRYSLPASNFIQARKLLRKIEHPITQIDDDVQKKFSCFVRVSVGVFKKIREFTLLMMEIMTPAFLSIMVML